ncbi:hypothetical protein [uncultured Metabacillus sp.]|uniref:hypothetical protein n=1 Tax=uncultured Metabacillus sp. TaxID=2860135 RepID=UPI002612A9F2|nr:hypothetical protein [uncultured Metabacillus sp.]
MKRNNKFLMHWLLVLVLIASAISPSFANAKNTKQQSLPIQSEESDQTVKQLMQKAMEQIEAIPETQSPQKNHKRVEYALFELQAAVDGNFETNNAIKS